MRCNVCGETVSFTEGVEPSFRSIFGCGCIMKYGDDEWPVSWVDE